MKKIKYNDTPQPEDLDEIVDKLSNNRDWSENGLLCENPEKKMNELCQLGILWWPIMDAIGSLRTLKEHNRLEI